MMQDANKYMNGIFRFYTFFEQLSYKILFIPSYRIEDIILASFTHVQQFSENREQLRIFLTKGKLAAQIDGWDRDALIGR
jgi:hypothetical protein